MKVIRIKIDGKMDQLDITIKKKGILKILENNAISKGTSQFKELYKWKHEGKEYICYGWYDGDAGFENKHELIPNGISSFIDDESSEILLFGDIFIVCMKGKKYAKLDVSEYGEVFSILCGGFDDCNTSDDEGETSEEPNTEDEDFIVEDDNEIIEDETYSDEELDEDGNEYD
mgnify:FL=1